MKGSSNNFEPREHEKKTEWERLSSTKINCIKVMKNHLCQLPLYVTVKFKIIPKPLEFPN